jgi:hypothetical protein
MRAVRAYFSNGRSGAGEFDRFCKLALNAGWDREVLAIELQGLIDLGFDVETTGFALGEIEVVLEEAAESSPDDRSDGAEDEIPLIRDVAVSRSGDVWRAGRHRLACGDARDKRLTRRFSAMNTLG